MESYFIFKTDNLTGNTTLVCCGSHDTAEECYIHWQSYMYGFMDGMLEIIGKPFFSMEVGTHSHSFRFMTNLTKDVEYFMLLNDAGHKLVLSIS